MKTIAIFKASGRQHLVSEGDVITLHNLGKQKGEKIAFSDVLFVAQEDGANTHIGTPTVAGYVTHGTVTHEQKGKKVLVVKYKPKVRYRRRVGHRQLETRVRIDAIKNYRES